MTATVPHLFPSPTLTPSSPSDASVGALDALNAPNALGDSSIFFLDSGKMTIETTFLDGTKTLFKTLVRIFYD